MTLKKGQYPVLPLDVPEDYVKRVINQFGGFNFLGQNLPFIRNLTRYVNEKRVLFIVYSDFRRKNISFGSSEKRLQVVPRDKQASDTLEAYFEDFLDWQNDLWTRRTVAIDFGNSSQEFVQEVMEDLLSLTDYPWDFGFALTPFHDSQKIEQMFKSMGIGKSKIQQKRSKSEQFVYFIQAGEDKKIKIGITKQIDSRLKQLQTGNPLPLRVLAIIPGGRKLEKELHLKFQEYSLKGEWFKLDGEVEKYVDKLRALDVEPEKSQFDL